MPRKNTRKVGFRVYIGFRLGGSPNAGFNCFIEFETKKSSLIEGPWL
jgi:hypothetical protein